MTREYKTYAVTLDQETRDLLDRLTERLALPSRSAILRLAVRELAARHGLKASATTSESVGDDAPTKRRDKSWRRVTDVPASRPR